MLGPGFQGLPDLGTEALVRQGERVARIAKLAEELAPIVGADPALAHRAAILAKADLQTEVVGEFPEVQGAMGRTYALMQGEDAAVAAAIEEHYKPQGPSDAVPAGPVSVAVALADKLDTLVGFWAIDEKPTGSKDPFALRRAALGVIRIVLANQLKVSLRDLAAVDADLLAFFHDRLKVQLREEGARHDLVDAVISADADDLLAIVRRVEALGAFLKADDGANLLAGYNRAANILRAEEKKDGEGAFDSAPDAALLTEPAEKALHAALESAVSDASAAVGSEEFEKAMTALSRLRAPVDAFFEAILVNAEDPALRANRLKLLSRFRAATRTVADFSRIAG